MMWDLPILYQALAEKASKNMALTNGRGAQVSVGMIILCHDNHGLRRSAGGTIRGEGRGYRYKKLLG